MANFTTVLAQMGNNVGIEVPDEVIAELGSGKRPPVVVTLNGFTYRSTVGVMGGRSLIPVAAAIRASAGVAGGEEHEVTLTLDDQPRSVEVPDELARALDAAGVREAFDELAPSRRKEAVRSVVDAKAEATRDRRIAAVVASLA